MLRIDGFVNTTVVLGFPVATTIVVLLTVVDKVTGPVVTCVPGVVSTITVVSFKEVVSPGWAVVP